MELKPCNLWNFEPLPAVKAAWHVYIEGIIDAPNRPKTATWLVWLVFGLLQGKMHSTTPYNTQEVKSSLTLWTRMIGGNQNGLLIISAITLLSRELHRTVFRRQLATLVWDDSGALNFVLLNSGSSFLGSEQLNDGQKAQPHPSADQGAAWAGKKESKYLGKNY